LPLLLALPRAADANQHEHARALPSSYAEGRSTPGRIELRMAPLGAFQGGLNGLQLTSPGVGDTDVQFGLPSILGFLVTSMVEPGFTLNMAYDNNANSTNRSTTRIGLTPFLKFNFWSSGHVNPFIEPFAGFLVQSDPGNSTTYFDGGLNAGVDLLVS